MRNVFKFCEDAYAFGLHLHSKRKSSEYVKALADEMNSAVLAVLLNSRQTIISSPGSGGVFLQNRFEHTRGPRGVKG
jgi:hypothetical protein